MSPIRRSFREQQLYREGYAAGRRERQDGEDRPLTLDDVANMTTDEINADWDRVQEALAANRRAGDDE